MISRRSFLRAAGVGAAVTTAASCTGSPGPGETSGSSVTVPSPSSRPGAVPPDWNRLRARLGGGLWLPGEAEWERGRRSFNQLYDGRAPAAVAACGTVEHVQACVEVARAAHLPIAARGGGHSYAGYSAPDGGVVVDLRGMSAVEVRPDGTAVVGAGARLIDVYAALAAAGRCLPAGTCPTVGIAGLTLGGGIGVLTRKFGLTCDRLLSAQVVTADGVVRTAAETSEPDLYWALRGGGGGNFGITTSFTFATEPAPDLTVFRLGFPAEAAPAVLGAWQEWVAGIPDELWANVGFSGGSPVRCGMSGCFVGSQAALNPLLDTLFARAGVRPTRRTVRQRGYLDAMRFFTGCAQRPIAQCTPEKLPREAFVASSRVLPAPVRDPAALVALLDGRDGMEVLLDPLGGAVARVDPTATAFPHRQALATIQIYQKTTVDGQVAAARAVAEVREALVGVGARGGYVNYIEAAMPGWSIAYYGGNVSRLGATARRYDPDRVFTFAQSVHRM